MKLFILSFLVLAVALISAIPAAAQETEVTVIDEGVVQVNDVIITLSRINREINGYIDALVQNGTPRETAKAEIEAKKGKIITGMIEEELVMQKAKELGMENEVEARINQQLLQQMNQFGLKSLDELYKAMRDEGIEPDDYRAKLRSNIMREWVYQSQVYDRVRFEITDQELKDYFAKHKEQFTAPATITLSEIFLSFAGANQDAVRAKAKDIVARLRKGEDFAKTAVENSDRPNVAEDKGSVGTIEVSQLNQVFQDPLKDLKAGDIADPIELDEGIEIIRVDARTAQGTESSFDENKVRGAIMTERVPGEVKKFLKSLRDDAYIKIAERYRPIVTPFLNEEAPEDTTASK